jgi:hypothetical protein
MLGVIREGVVRLVLIVVLAVMLWADNTTVAALAAILTLYAGLLASQIIHENFPNQKRNQFLILLLPRIGEHIADPAWTSVMLKTAGQKIYRFCDSIFGNVLFWGCVLFIVILCVAGLAGYADSYLIPFEAIALIVLLFVVIEYWRSRPQQSA